MYLLKTAMKTSLLLLSIFSATGSTKFEAFGQVKCLIEDPWCFHIKFYEYDNFVSTSDNLDQLGYKCLRGASIWNYALKGEQFWDGPFNNYWELALRIKHNCTAEGEFRELWWIEPLHNITEDVVTITWNRDVTYRGTETEMDFF